MNVTFILIVMLFKDLNNELHFWRLQLELAVLGSKLSRFQFSWEVSEPQSPVTTDIIKPPKKLQMCFKAHELPECWELYENFWAH